MNEGKAYLIEKINERVGTEAMRKALLALVETDIAFAWENLYRWEVADQAGRQDMAMFFEPMEDSELSAVDYVGQLKQKDADGTPTSIDLNACLDIELPLGDHVHKVDEGTGLCTRCGKKP